MRLVRIRWVSKNASLVLCAASVCVPCVCRLWMFVFNCVCHMYVCICDVYVSVFCNSSVSLITRVLRLDRRMCARAHLPLGDDGPAFPSARPSPLNCSSFIYFIVNASCETNRTHRKTPLFIGSWKIFFFSSNNFHYFFLKSDRCHLSSIYVLALLV